MNVHNRNKKSLLRATSVIALAAAILVGSQANAQTVSKPANAQSVFKDEIIVTAQKREENLQNVGVSVTAFTGAQLEALGLNDAIDLVSQTPGLEVSGAGGGTINTFSIRGVTQNDFAPIQEAPVAVYVDDGYIANGAITNFSLFDIDRVEVLRGPQGTLFGRNATGGLLHYITHRPTENTEGFLDVEVGEQGRFRIEGASGGSIGKHAQARISLVYNTNSGLIKNSTGPDLQQTEDFAIRGQVAFQPSEDLDVLLRAQFADGGGAKGGYAHTLAAGNATDFFGYVDADGDPYTVSTDFDGYTDTKVTDYAAHINWDLGNVHLTSITAYQSFEHGYGEDADVSPNDIYNFEQTQDVDQITQEIRLGFEGPNYSAVIGAYYLNIDGEYSTVQSGDAYFGTGVGYPAGTSENVDVTQETTAYALFGQVEFDLFEQLKLTAGARWNQDKKNFDYFSTDIYFVQGSNFQFADSFKDTDWSGKLQLNYQVSDDLLLYAGFNRGIKSGGFNMPLFPLINAADYAFDGEVLNSYEGGFKWSLGGNTRLNASAFYYDYDNYQAYSFDGFSTFLFNANAESLGAEIELIANPIDGLDLLLGASWLDSEVKDVPATISATGTEDAVLAPSITLNALVRYSWNAFGGRMAAQADGNWKDDHNFNLVLSPAILEEAYGTANLKLSYTTGDGNWTGSVFVKNVTNEYYRSYAFDTSGFFGANENVPGVARWIGAGLRFNWGQ